MKARLAVFAVLVALAVGASLAYQAAARDRDYRSLVARGDAALKDDLTFGAIEAYSGAIALRPSSMLAHLRRGETYRRRGDLEAAARDLRTAATLDPTATRPLEELGDVLYLLQRTKRAAESYDSCLKLDDRSARVTYKLALAQYRDGQLDAAQVTLERALRLDGGMADAQYLLGLCQRDRRRPDEAAKAFERAVELSPGSIPAREELADLYTAGGRRDDAIAQLQILAGLERDRPERQIALAEAYARSAQPDLAVLTLSRMLGRGPSQPAVYEALGSVWLDLAESRQDRVALAKAVEALARAAEGASATSAALTLYGRSLLASGQPEAAARALQRATERYPVWPAAWLYFANASERLGRWEVARRALVHYGDIAVEEADAAARAARIAGLALRSNEWAEAAVWYRKAMAAAPADAQLAVSLAEVQIRTGDQDGATETVRAALTRAPGQPALSALARRLGLTAPAAASGR